MAKYINYEVMNTPLYGDVFAFLTQQARAQGEERVFEMDIRRCPVGFAAVHWAGKNGLYRSTTLAPKQRFLIQVTREGEEFIQEYLGHLISMQLRQWAANKD